MAKIELIDHTQRLSSSAAGAVVCCCSLLSLVCVRACGLSRLAAARAYTCACSNERAREREVACLLQAVVVWLVARVNQRAAADGACTSNRCITLCCAVVLTRVMNASHTSTYTHDSQVPVKVRCEVGVAKGKAWQLPIHDESIASDVLHTIAASTSSIGGTAVELTALYSLATGREGTPPGSAQRSRTDTDTSSCASVLSTERHEIHLESACALWLQQPSWPTRASFSLSHKPRAASSSSFASDYRSTVSLMMVKILKTSSRSRHSTSKRRRQRTTSRASPGCGPRSTPRARQVSRSHWRLAPTRDPWLGLEEAL